MQMPVRCAATVLSLVCFVIAVDSQLLAAGPDFGRDVRPILAKRCFQCHGPDPETREADLRLDQQAGATDDLGGYAAVVPGDANASELLVRVLSEDEDLRMPPADSDAPLSEAEVTVLRKWINEGGRYTTHWAFVPPEPPAIPSVRDPPWCRGTIDCFIAARRESTTLQPAAETGRESLIRRLYLDLTGTSPDPDEVERFINDKHPTAERKLIDRLLASPQYAERFARSWLDLARYSDTNGYEKDRPRSIWPYRDWVIGAIGADMPFDRFSIEQLAGDMLPSADLQQRVATGFHRNTMLNEEGGIDPLEYRFYTLVDRVATTGTVWMGMTTGCAQCHTHKYDPITHRDYYALMALMNSADEPDLVVANESRQQRLKVVEQRVDELATDLAAKFLPTLRQIREGDFESNPVDSVFVEWFAQLGDTARHWLRLRPTSMSSTMPKLTLQSDDSILASGDVTKRDVYQLSIPIEDAHLGATAMRLEVLPHESLPAGGPGMAFYEGRRGDFFLSELAVQIDEQPIELQLASHSFGKISVGSGNAEAANVIDGEGSTGWSTSSQEGKPNQLVLNFAKPLSKRGELKVKLLFERHFAAALGRFRLSLAQSKKPAVASNLPVQWDAWLVDMTKQNVGEEHFALLQKSFVMTSDTMVQQRNEIKRLKASIPEVIRTLGMQQRDVDEYRSTFRHHRGEYLQPREPVEPGVPVAFRAAAEGPVRDRLEFAQWLVSDRNPLVGRVTVNRAWREFFGIGIVDTAGDFGTQSRPPSHPRLLDHLAAEFVAHDWSLKRLHRQIVASATYHQSIAAPSTSDPENSLLAVFPMRRFNAEQIRDAFLSASGLMSYRVGGPSVYPPQPASVMQLAYGSPSWKTSQGANRYRRSIYTFSKRTAPFAAYSTFDGPTGEVCLARRGRSTTPLQALTLLNDEMYVEIASALAARCLREVGHDAPPERIAARIFRRLLTRDPSEDELTAILEFHRELHESEDRWMLVARALMNTDEAITTP